MVMVAKRLMEDLAQRVVVSEAVKVLYDAFEMVRGMGEETSIDVTENKGSEHVQPRGHLHVGGAYGCMAVHGAHDG